MDETVKAVLDTIGRYTPEILLVVIFMLYNLQHDKVWRDFLAQQAQAQAVALAAMAKQIENAANSIVENTKVLTAHDARAQAVWAEQRDSSGHRRSDRAGND